MTSEAREINRLITSEILKLGRRKGRVKKAMILEHVRGFLAGNQSYRITRILSALKDQGVLELQGEGREGWYKYIHTDRTEDDVEENCWARIKEYDRDKQRSKIKNETRIIPREEPPDSRLAQDQLVTTLIELKRREMQLREQISEVELVNQLGVLDTQLRRVMSDVDGLRVELTRCRTDLKQCQDDYTLVQKERDELLQENRNLHSKLNGRE